MRRRKRAFLHCNSSWRNGKATFTRWRGKRGELASRVSVEAKIVGARGERLKGIHSELLVSFCLLYAPPCSASSSSSAVGTRQMDREAATGLAMGAGGDGGCGLAGPH